MLPNFLKAKIERNVTFLSLGFALIFFGYNAVQQFITPYFAQSGSKNLGFYSLILIYLFFFLGSPISAVIVSKIGAKKAMFWGGLVYAVFIFSLMLKIPLLIYPMSALVGLAASFLWTGQNNYIVKASEEKSYGTNSGYFNSFLTVGSATGSLVLGILFAKFSPAFSFALFSLFPILGVLIILQLIDLKTVDQKASQLALVRKAITSVSALKLSAFYFAFSFIFGQVIGIIPIEIARTLSIAYVGLLSFVFWIMPILLSYIVGRLSDIKGRKPLILTAYGVSILGLIFLFYSNIPAFLVLGIFLVAISYAIFSPISFALVGEFSIEKNLLAITALFWMARNVGVLLALLISSQIQSRPIYLVSILIVLVSLAILFPILKVDPNTIKAKLAEEIK